MAAIREREDSMKAISETRLRNCGKFGLGLATLVLLCVGTTVAQTTYTVTDLGTLGGTFSVAEAVNNKGWANGFSTLPGELNKHAALWVQGRKIDLGTLGGPNSLSGFPISESGEVTGGAEPPSTPDPNGEDFCGFGTHLICLPFLWQNGLMTSLPTLGGNNGFAQEINNRGQIAGVAENSTPEPTCVPPEPLSQVLQFEPVIWASGQIQQRLPTFAGDSDGVANGINDNSQAVGGSGNCTAPFHALLWENGTPTDLGNLGGTMGNFALDINNQGQVIGNSDLPGDTTFHGFLWQNGGPMTDLGTLPGDVSSFADGINSKGQVVGFSMDATGNIRAFLWQNGVMTDLNTLIPAGSPLFLLAALNINSRGEIAGCAFELSSGEIHAFLATPSDGEAASESATPNAPDEARESPKVTLPEKVRKLLQQQLRFGRFEARLTESQ